jgi:hypothetical protein
LKRQAPNTPRTLRIRRATITSKATVETGPVPVPAEVAGSATDRPAGGAVVASVDAVAVAAPDAALVSVVSGPTEFGAVVAPVV